MNFYNDNKSLKFYLSHPVMDKIIKLKERDFVDSDNDNLAPVDVEDAIDSYDKVLEIVGDLAANVLEVNAEDVDHEGPQVVNNEIVYAKGTQKNHEAMRDAGLYGMSLPRKYKGLNFPYVPYVMAAEFDLVFAFDQSIGDIKGDCPVTAGVAADLFVVYEAVEVLVGGTDVQQDPLFYKSIRQCEFTAVCQRAAFGEMFMDTGQQTFRTERNPDGFIKILGKRIGTNTKFPVTV